MTQEDIVLQHEVIHIRPIGVLRGFVALVVFAGHLAGAGHSNTIGQSHFLQISLDAFSWGGFVFCNLWICHFARSG